MARVQLIDDERAASALSDLLNGNSRRRPVVVVTTPAGRAEPWIDVEEIAREAGNLADVYLMPTGAFTWGFSGRMPDGTQVYGGAGRVYPVGHEWIRNLGRSPLRFAFDAADGERATQELISDALRMAASAGLLQAAPTQELRQVSGTIRSVVAGRAVVDVGNHMPAVIAEELTVADVSIERLLGKGQQVRGLYHPESNRIDVRASLRPPVEALAAYAVGDVVLARVAMVRNGKAELVLYPRTGVPEVKVAVLRVDVTTNPADDLRTLMTVGEVVRARVTSTGPTWALVLNDVDDDEPVVVAPSLLPDGPPWLTEEAEEADHGPDEQLPVPPAPPMPVEEVAEDPEPEPEPAAPFIPTPAMFDRSRPRPAQPTPAQPAPPRPGPRPGPGLSPQPTPAATLVPEPSNSTKELLRKIDGMNGRVRTLERELEALRTELAEGRGERDQLRYLLAESDRRANRAENELKSARSRLRKAGNRKSQPQDSAAPVFADREQGFRYLVLTQWATRTLPGEQCERPLADYEIGPDFLDSLEHLEGIKDEKVADVVFEVVTGLAQRGNGREVHRLRTGPGGSDPVRTRDDGAVAWRVSLQVNTAGARRLHYWALPDGRVELINVALHDQLDV